MLRHIGMSSHNPNIALKAVESGIVDVLMFSINPPYDMESAETDIYDPMEFKRAARWWMRRGSVCTPPVKRPG